MDWMEKEREELEKRQVQKKAIQANLDLITQNKILERIEKERLSIEKETTYRFMGPSAPLGTWSFIGELGYQTFSFDIKEDGIYLTFALSMNKRTKNYRNYILRINPTKITDEDIHNWFGFLVEPKKIKGLRKYVKIQSTSIQSSSTENKKVWGSLIEFLSSCIMRAFRK